MNSLSKLTLATLFLGFSNLAFAQSENASVKDLSTSTTSIQTESPYQKPKASRFTPEISLISSTFVGSDSNNARTLTKISIGANIDIGEGNLVTETGILFRQIGANETAIINSKSIDLETDLNYLSVPISAKYYFSNQHESSFFAKIGLAPSLLVASQLSDTTSSARSSDPNAFAIDGLIGLGGKYQITEQIGLVLEVSYWRGLAPVYSSTNIYTSNFINTLGINIDL